MNERIKAMEAEELAKARLAAQIKSPADYDLPADDQRDSSEIEADLARLRLELTVTVDELAGRLDPKVLTTTAKTKAKSAVSDFGVKAKQFGKDLLHAEPHALKTAGIAAAGVIALLLLRKFGK